MARRVDATLIGRTIAVLRSASPHLEYGEFLAELRSEPWVGDLVANLDPNGAAELARTLPVEIASRIRILARFRPVFPEARGVLWQIFPDLRSFAFDLPTQVWVARTYGGQVERRRCPVCTRVSGKPILVSSGYELPISFSIAHSLGLEISAVCEGIEIGIDLEASRPIAYERILPLVCGTEEARVVAEKGPDGFLRVWTHKESALKAAGVGVSHGMTWLSSTTPIAENSTFVTSDHAPIDRRFLVFNCPLFAGSTQWHASLAIAGHAAIPSFERWRQR